MAVALLAVASGHCIFANIGKTAEFDILFCAQFFKNTAQGLR
jgi:hypothetical protein